MVVREILQCFEELHEDDVRSCGMGQHGEDIQLSERAREMLPWSIECKNVERLNFWEAFEQAKANCGSHTPVVIAKRNQKDILCVLRLNDALYLAKRKRSPGTCRLTEPPEGTSQWLRRLANTLDCPSAAHDDDDVLE